MNFNIENYLNQFKNQFRYWLWIKVREPKIRQQYHPSNIQKLLKGSDDETEEEFENRFNKW